MMPHLLDYSKFIGVCMEEFVAYIVKNLVSKPQDVVVSSCDQENVRIEIRVALEDVGKVIGRRGNTINALRTIVRTVAARFGKKVQVELVQDIQLTDEVTEEEGACEACAELPAAEPALA